MSRSGRGPGSPGYRRKLTLAGRAIAPEVGFLAPPRTHTGSHDRALAEGRLGVGHLTTWARLQDGVVETNRESCPNCGGKPEIIGAIVEQRVIEKILTHLGLDRQTPPKGRARESGQDFAA